MKHFHWVGMVNEEELMQYQTGVLHKNAALIPEHGRSIMISSLPWILPPILILFLSMFFKRRTYGSSSVSNPYIFVGVLIGLAGILLHEVLHAVVYPRDADVYIGIYPKELCAVALASYPMSRGRFIFMSALPVILGLIPLAAFWMSKGNYPLLNGILFGMACMGCVSPAPDFYNIYLVLRHTSTGCQIQFWKDGLYYIR